MRPLLQDVRFGARMLAKNPGFTAVAVFTLALGIGANTAIFSVSDAVLLRSLPIRKPGELVLVKQSNLRESVSRFSYPAYREFGEKCESFAGLLAFGSVKSVIVHSTGANVRAQSERAVAQLVSGGFFQVLGVPALKGRMLGPEDDRVTGGHPVAVISHGYWKRRWAQAPEIVGQTLVVNGVVFTIVGVAPPEFFGVEVGAAPDIWMPTMMQSEIQYRTNYNSGTNARIDMPWLDQAAISWLTVMGRLRPGINAGQAAAEATVVFRQIELGHGKKPTELRIELEQGGRGISELRRQFSERLKILMAMMGLVLLVACANVANLLLARAAARSNEIGMRLALGAGRGRLVRQLLTESTMLAMAGGALGLLFADWARRLLPVLAFVGSRIPPINISIDLRVLAFTAALSMLTGILFGIVPALQATSEVHGFSGSRTPRRFALRMFVVAQVASSLLLMIAAGLFARTLRNLEAQDTGYEGDNLLLVEINPRELGYQTAQLRDLYDRLLERIRAVPGVRLASISLAPPLSGDTWTTSVSVAGHTARQDSDLRVHKMLVTPEYFDTVGLPVTEGRGLTTNDARNASPVAVINHMMARYFFGERSPIGQRFWFGAQTTGGGVEIVGVVRDSIYNNLRDRIPPMVYLPLAQQMEGAGFHGPPALRDLEVRTAPGAASAVAAQLRRAIAEVDPKLPVAEISTLLQRVKRSAAQDRAIAQVTAFFGALALALAAIGLYGVMSYAVARRTAEIGVRMALGALPENVRWLIIQEALGLAAAGIALGVPASLLSLRVISSQLFGLSPHDPTTILSAILVMTFVAAASGYFPARRASRLDPMVALRYE